MRRTLTAVAVLGAALLGSGPASATVPGQNGAVAYQVGPGSFGTGTPDIYSTGAGRLTTNPGPDANASWSPDGAKIAFDSAPTDTAPRAIWTMSANGAGKVQITAPAVGEED